MSELTARGWHAYCFALQLLDPLASISDQPAADLAHLLVAWDRLCAAYRENKFKKQFDLFLAHDETELARWAAFIERQCFRQVLDSPRLTRSLLWATGLLSGSTEQRTTGLSTITAFLAELAAACRHNSLQPHQPR